MSKWTEGTNADIATFRQDPSLERVPSLFTVRLLVNYVKAKLAA